jgi:hypothetical protein
MQPTMHTKTKRGIVSYAVILLATLFFYFVFEHWDSLKGAIFFWR